MGTAAQNKTALDNNLIDEITKAMKEKGLEALLGYVIGGAAGAAILTTVISIAKSQLNKMRGLAEENLRSKYGDQRIHVFGQQIGGAFSSEECWSWVHTVGGTLWVQNVYLTKDDGLSFVVFFHPDPKFKLDKDIIREYRGSNQCPVK